MNDKLLDEVTALLAKYYVKNDALALDICIMVAEHEKDTLKGMIGDKS